MNSLEFKMNVLRFGSLILALCMPILCACTSPVFKGSDGIVRYQEFEYKDDKPSFELVLVQETHKDYENILSEKGENSHIKKAPIDEYEYLIETLVDECGLLDLIESAPSWKSIYSPRVISVENEYGKWILHSEHCMGECTSYQQSYCFVKFIDAFRNSFDNIFTLQVIDNNDKSGVEFFKEEQERLNKIANQFNKSP